MIPFDRLAPSYGVLWSEAPEGLRQRNEVWRELDGLFHAGERVLDLGCGIGDDALHLAALGVMVVGIDSSPKMVGIARRRGVDARELEIEALHQLAGVFDGAISNFGALNCVKDIALVAATLENLVRPGGLVAICVLSRLCWRESARYLLHGDSARATRRWRGRAEWRGITIYYRSLREWRAAFTSGFKLTRCVAIGDGDHQLLLFRRR